MAESKRRDEWGRASSIIAAVFNSQRTKKQGPVHPWQFNPIAMAERKRARPDITDPAYLAAQCGVTKSI